MHADEVPIASETVRALVDQQFPRWRGLPIRRLETAGTVNAVFRIGDGLSARFPRRPGEPEALRRTLLAEAEAARRIAAVATVPTPLPVAVGDPGPGYPMPWSVQTWLPGATAEETDPATSEAFAADLAELVAALRGADTRGERFTGDGRGGDLREHDEAVDGYLGRSEGLLDVPRLRAMWVGFRELPRRDPDAMTHGDLIPGNVLVSSAPAGVRLAGVLDVGGFAAADPALELVGAWHLLDDGPRAVFRRACAIDDLQWERGRAWAFVQAVGLVEYYLRSNPPMSRLGSRTLERLVATG
ncbi:aminoglycoside phosphotransferase family protein [Amnibacterium sp.]|uniref:aminoglycoside phosphotransferase family protein n=1 Tax=Amnibacterium sp. TaxID=1872496 RepID=UPI00262A8B38|nr:aminoglycoside phosphotransferase family protein [Amnibacterium sp.]MCU1472584.1 aminoglycoside phosphotransferase [Amnibacterium sp.]